ncbi:hypothetical protein C8R45DRAFT_1070200 [Mycena sanguinolenta]|nr:hypothetical protein C8R45DRAFT_1070200 [Mycena sanguinolenta]
MLMNLLSSGAALVQLTAAAVLHAPPQGHVSVDPQTCVHGEKCLVLLPALEARRPSPTTQIISEGRVFLIRDNIQDSTMTFREATEDVPGLMLISAYWFPEKKYASSLLAGLGRIVSRVSRRACKTGLPRLAEFEFGCAGSDGLAWGLA